MSLTGTLRVVGRGEYEEWFVEDVMPLDKEPIEVVRRYRAIRVVGAYEPFADGAVVVYDRQGGWSGGRFGHIYTEENAQMSERPIPPPKTKLET